MEFTAENLLKLTVPQLKALCKEQHISGYSKLSKPLLIQKISTLKGPAIDSNIGTLSGGRTTVASGQDRTPAQPSSSNPRNTTSLLQATFAENIPKSSPRASIATSIQVPDGASGLSRPLNCAAPLNLVPSVQVLDPQDEEARTNPSSIQGSEQRPGQSLSRETPVEGTKRKAVSSSEKPTARKKSKALAINDDEPGPCANPLTEVCDPQSTINQATSCPSLAANIPGQLLSKSGRNQNHPQGKSAVTKRPLPSTPTRPGLFNPTPRPVGCRFKPVVVHEQFKPPSGRPQPRTPIPGNDTTLRYLELSSSVFLAPDLHPIRLPPKLSQRKKVKVYALILSYTDPRSLNQCARASRVLRYAAYHSAYYKLARDFAGKRFTSLIGNYSPSTTNMWPYMRARLAEYNERKTKYQTSFLGRVVSDHSIAKSVWTSPDHVDQATIAMRFVLTKLWFWLSLGGSLQSSSWSHGSVTDAQEVILGEVWRVQVSYSSHTEDLYILAATCEVIGRVPSSVPMPANFVTTRADWSQWIQERLASANYHSLSDNLTWPNHEEYDKGISRLWLRRTEREGTIGEMKRIVARRYVIASLMANSVSGRWMTSSDMSHELDGLPSTGYYPQPSHTNKPKTIHLYLPLHHHIESVHFATSKGLPFHAAIATVQTPHREYYILKDNGMQVGCEEEGVSSVWAGLVGCTAQGVISSPRM